ncbi:unnamed protein product (macronuclear) [Paramecium tetraurelia]|uniref:Uncharacterized protein n=1 Tax=Paramecium tetraurelia TaxID=5888 RepID=A0C0Z6_PARTE|nr:uncharacterized protein GSPATT00033939001 [Paramecium tetraurelia]CAK64463.1 unnamed protein product [Paramecium tetraurelia]|eukprot:XP_001431861.1 hypothetical protein (macronuclear) [Paramecium tetraurelia strain d4-2]
MQSFYKLAFQTLSNFHSLGLVSDEEKSYLKEVILNWSNPQLDTSQDQMSILVLQKIQAFRNQAQRTQQTKKFLCLIEEETDEDENF